MASRWERPKGAAVVAAIVMALVMGLLAPSPVRAQGAVQVLQASGGGALSADHGADGTFTALTNPSLREAAPGDISTGSLVLRAPAGFEFRRQRVTAFASNGTSLAVSASPACTAAGQTAYVTAAADRITVHVCQTSAASGTPTRLTLSGLAVRPTAATPLTAGDLALDPSSTATVQGVDATTSFGRLAVVPGALAAITVTPAALAIEAGGTAAFTATPADAHGNARSDAVTLSADPAAGTITEGGLLTAATRAGTVREGIIATAGGVRAAVDVTIQPGPAVALVVTPADATAEAGEAVAYAVRAVDAHDNDRGPAAGADLALVDADGAPVPGCAGLLCTVERAGTYAVTARAEGLEATTGLQVEPAALDRLTIAPDPAGVRVGETVAFTARPADRFGNERADVVAFSAVPAAGTVDAAGVLTAATSPGSIADAVTASVDDLSESADLVITAGPVDAVAMAPATATTPAGEAVTFTATATDRYGNPVAGESTSATIAPSDGGSLDGATCTALACSATAVGTYVVTATVDGRSASATLVVEPAEAADLQIVPATITATAGGTTPLGALVTDAYDNVRDDVVTFSALGDAGTVEVDDAGTAVLRARTAAGRIAPGVQATLGDLVATAPVEVLAGPIATIDLSPAQPTAAAGEGVPFVVTGADAFANPVEVDPVIGIAPDGSGATDGSTCDEALVCRAERAGRYLVTAAAGDLTDTAALTVTPAAVASIQIDPEVVAVTARETAEVIATPVDRFGNVTADEVTLAVDDPEVGTIVDGLFTAGAIADLHEGAITAVAGAVRATADVRILAGEVARLEITPSTAAAAAGQATPFAVRAADADDNTVEGVVAALAITAEDGTSVAGAACTAAACTAERAGTYRVTASSGSATPATATLTVTAAALDRLDVRPAAGTTPAGQPVAVAVTGADAFGNPAPTAAALDLVRVDGPAATDAGCDADGCSAEVAGRYAVTATDGDVVGTAELVVVAAALDQVVVDPVFGEVPAGGQVAFRSQGIDQFGNPTDDVVAYEVTDPRVGTIDPAGLLTAGEVADIFPGAVRASVGDREVFADVEVLPGDVAELVLTPGTSTIPAGGDELFAVEGRDRFGNSLGGVDATVAIAPADGGIAAGAACDAGGLCTATRAGTYDVTAAHAGGATGAAELTVLPGEAATVAIAPDPATLAVRGSQQLTAEVVDAYGNPLPGAATFAMLDGGAGTVTADGLLTAGGDAGTFADAVEATADGVTGTADVVVLAGELVAIELDPATSTTEAGAPAGVTARGIDAEGNDLGPVPVDLTVDGGTCDAAACTATVAGRRTITAVHASGATATAVLDVLPAAAADLRVTPDPVDVAAGGTVDLTATVTDRFGNVRADDVTYTAEPAAGDVTPAGRFTASTTAGEHPRGVTATAGGLVVEVPVRIRAGAPSRIELSPAEATTSAGEPSAFQATGFDEHGNPTGPVPATLAIDEPGTCGADACGATVAGTYAVTATAGEASATARLVVVAAAPASLVLDPAEATTSAGEPQPFRATAADRYGNPVEDVTATLAISTPGRCDAGACTAEAVGTYAVTATAGGVAGTAVLTVVAGPLATLAIDPVEATITAGEHLAFAASGADAHGNPVDPAVTWTADPAVGTIAADGVLTAAELPATVERGVTATAGGLEAVARVTVTPGPATRLVLDPSDAVIAAGDAQPFAVTARDAFGTDLGPVAATLSVDEPGSCDATSCSATRAGAYVVTATAEDGTTGTAVLRVVPAAVAAVELSPAAVEAAPETSVPLTATATDRFGNVVDGPVAWSADPAAGTITDDGVLTTGRQAGTYPAAVTASSGGVSATADVVVIPGPVVGIALTPAEATITAGSSQGFSAHGVDAYGNGLEAVPVSLTVTGDPGGPGAPTCQGTTCTGTRAGTYQVLARTADGIEATATLVVTAAAAVRVGITADPTTVNPRPLTGSTSVLTVRALDPWGNPVPGAAVSLSMALTGSASPLGSPSLSATSLTTGGDGTATATYTAGGQAGRDRVQAVIGSYGAAVDITVRSVGGAVGAGLGVLAP